MKTLSLIILVMLLVSCKKESKETKEPPKIKESTEVTMHDIVIDNNDIIIKYGVFNSWCAANDSLIISANNVWLVEGYPCDDKKVVVNQLTISSEDKASLLQSFNQTAFDKLQLNSYMQYVDGSDFWISVKNGTYFHHIRYAYGDSASIINIKNFVKELDKLKARCE